jgi:signal transduction histidine kinase/ActR/RegA family two-component response regulator
VISTSLPILPLVVVLLAFVLIVAASRHFWRLARAERSARTETERKLLHTDHLQQITATLSRARMPDEVVQACLPELLHAATADAGVFVVTADDGSTFELVHAIGYDSALSGKRTPVSTSARTPTADAIRRRELIVLRADPLRAAKYPEIALEPWLQSARAMIVVPLVTSGRAIGAVVLTFSEAHACEEDEREFLLNAGRHTAQALDRARLYAAAQKARDEAEAFRVRADSELRERQKAEEALRSSEARYRLLAARTNRLYTFSAGLSEAVTLSAVARATVTLGKVVVGAASGSVVMAIDNATAFETIYADEHTPDAAPARARFRADPGLCATVAMRTRQPVFVGSFEEWQEKYPRSASIAADGGYASAAFLPLKADGAVLGVLTFNFTVPVNFDEGYAALLASVALHCSQALDRARLYETTDRAREEAETANRSKDDFLSTVSHELRTPLNAILGWASMLRAGSVDPSRSARAIEAIFNNATRQGRLIEELLDVSKIIAGRASVELEDVDLGENLRGAVESMMPLAARESLDIHFVPPQGIQVHADPRRLEQIFLNLLSNAVKFTPAGGKIEVAAMTIDRSARVRVTDSGAGIAPDFLPHVFERFRQADSSATRGVGGLGLGLFIAQQLIEAQGGTIEAASEGPGRGATFTVTLPLAAKAMARLHSPAVSSVAAAPQPLDPSYASGVRVLVVDDEPDALEMITAALEAYGATVTAASSVRDALQALTGGDFDVLLSDIAMPGEGGYDLIRQVRRAGSARFSAIPAAAVTASASDEERARALTAGFQMHIAKPVEPGALARAVGRLARDKSANAPAAFQP